MAEVKRRQEIDYYRVLQVDPSAEPEVIEAAYKALVKKYHPDRNRAPEAEHRMAQINMAYDVLGDADKRRDYNLIRDSLNRYNRTASTQEVPNVRPSTPPRPHPSETTRTGGQSATPRAGTEDYNESHKRARHRPNYFVERQESEKPRQVNPWAWLGVVLALLILFSGITLLLETVFGNPLNTSFIVSKNNNHTATTGSLVITAPPATSTPAQTGVLSREGALAFLQTPDMFDRRVVDLVVTQPDTLRVTVKLSDKGGATNAESYVTSSKPDSLDTLRQSEVTAYTLIYSLYRQYPDLNRLTVTLTDSKDERRQVYKADMTRGSALSFYPWRGDMTPQRSALPELTKAAFEDRLNAHYGAPLDEISHKTLATPTAENIQAEISAWVNAGDGIQVRMEGSGAISISYLLNKNEQEMKSDWAKIFYALYTRFPYLDRISISKGVAGAASGEVRVCERTLFNRITQSGWAQRVFSKGVADPKSVIDSLPNDPTLSYQPPQSLLVEVRPGGSGKGKNWEIAEPSRALLQSRIGNLVSQRGKFLLLNVKLTNLGTTREWPNVAQLFTLVDGQGYTYRPDPTAALSQYLNPPSNAAPYGPIEAGRNFTILLVFDIPDNISNLRLLMQDDNTSVVLPLT